MGTRWFLIAIALLAAGCQDDTGPRDRVPPAAPRGVYTVTGDGDVFVHWLANTEGDVAGYRIYEAPCASGDGCPYDRVGTTTGTSFTVTGLTNGQTRYFAVSAYDVAGNESDLSAEILFDTPRPEGVGQVLNNFNASAAGSGYDFSAFTARNWDDPQTDMYFGFNGSIDQMFVPAQTSIQDYGYASSLDAVDFAPTTGWSPSGTVELIVGHCYIVWTHDDHYAKFRVTEIRPAANGAPAKIVFDWAMLDERLDEWRRHGLRIGFTNGCFDLLHRGHVKLLAEARAACDRLVVGLNSDGSTTRLKGRGRPINPAEGRAEVLAALEAVDLVVVFEEDTPLELIKRVRPAVLVKGADYTREEVVGREVVEKAGGDVVLVDLVPGHSTTAIVERARPVKQAVED